MSNLQTGEPGPLESDRWTFAELARELGYTRMAITQMVKRKTLPTIEFRGKRYIPNSAVELFKKMNPNWEDRKNVPSRS